MKLKDFREIVKYGLRHCPNISVSFRTREHSFVATVIRKECKFMMTQPALVAAANLYSEYGFFFYVDCVKDDILTFKIVYKL